VASLSWPTDGQVVKRFGDPRADGRLKWQGIILSAPAGSDVRAVYNGRVIFSDWLDGMGLLLIIEHGDGYMSLYAHNQDLLKEVGEWVEPGEMIAHVGDSGGRAAAGLYFEIRKNGEPVNPGQWFR
jgi:septal ring factor EnvC (AmiA/AmiB activator)